MSTHVSAWLSEVGLLLDLISFILLSVDLVSSLHGEREGRDATIAIERKIFSVRYGVFAPDQETQDQQQRDFNAAIDQRILLSDASMKRRRSVAYLAIAIAIAGFALQIAGGWPN
jgi:hypothetical protein